MADQHMPNDASRKSKAEGERRSPDSENAGADQRSAYRNTEDDAAGITNRSLDEEMPSGLSGGRPGPGVEFNAEHAEDAVNRAGADTSTPRRYEQPVDDDEDPVMPSDDSTLNTKI